MVSADDMYGVGERFSGGAYGHIHEGRIPDAILKQHCATRSHTIRVAVKKSHTAHWIDHPMLRHEACALLLLSGHDGFPRVYAWGRSQWFEYLYMDRLGPCLSQALVKFGGYYPYNLRSGLLLMSQMLDILKYLHSRNIIHRDVKPDNLLFGHPGGNRAEKLHLIDFGLAIYYRDPVSKLHRPLQEKQKMVGTMHYASSNLLQGISPSRRDDLESLAYTFLWILRGKLPWNSLSNSAAKKLKATMTGSVLFSGLPSELAKFYDYVRGLEYDEDPDYDRWHGIFRNLLDPYTGADEPFDFASSRNFEDVDDHLIDGPADWPKVSNSNPVEDNDEEDCGSCRYRYHSGFIPNSSWPNPAGVKEEDLFGDEDKMIKGRVGIVSTPPSILEGGYVDVVYPEYEEMVLI